MRKKILLIIIFVFIIYITICIYNNFVVTEIKTTYQVDKVKIKETFTSKKVLSSVSNLYHFNLTSDNNKFEFKIESPIKTTKFIEKLYTFKEKDLFCIYPIFKDKNTKTDILCKNNDYYINYLSIENPSSKLLAFKKEVEKVGYVNNDKKQIKQIGNIKVNQNFITNPLLIWTYQDFIYLNANQTKKIQVFEKDRYYNTLGFMLKDIYVVPDYDQKIEFDKLYYIEMNSSNTKEIKIKGVISYNSVIQGIVDDEAYIYDRSNQKQWKLSYKTKKIEDITEDDQVKYYDGNNWSTISVKALTEEKEKFKKAIPNLDKNLSYDSLYEVGNDKNGYYYLLKKQDDGFTYVYKVMKDNHKNIKYLFKAKNIEEVNCFTNYFYFIAEEKIIVYNENIGLQEIVTNKEFIFNHNNIYGAYVKE